MSLQPTNTSPRQNAERHSPPITDATDNHKPLENRLLEVASARESGAEASTLPSIRSDYKPNVNMVRFLLNDFVGGGKGGAPKEALAFFQHYLHRYVESHPSDTDVGALEHLLTESVYEMPSEWLPITEIAEQIFTKLQEHGHLFMSGGFDDGDGGGHALFYEFHLDTDGMVTFHVTNSGSGLEHHPKYERIPNRENFYRTLIFQGATIENLRKHQFVELLVSFNKRRPPSEQLTLMPGTYKIKDLYDALLYAWPGKGPFKATNPGGPQKSSSCSLQAILKWFKGVAKEHRHPWIMLWIKLSALSDYLDNVDTHSGQFIDDALRKISTHIDKMDKDERLPEPLFALWKEVESRAHAVRGRALTTEVKKRHETALSSVETGLQLDKYQIATLTKRDAKGEVVPTKGYLYLHTFPGEAPPIAELSELSSKFIAPLYHEMAHRLNFLRLLPDCDTPHALEPDTLEAIGTLLERFYYKGTHLSTHIPDSFIVDCLNAWMILYYAAQKTGMIDPPVLLEWMRGASLLVDTYSREYSFDSKSTRDRWIKLTSLISVETKVLTERVDATLIPEENHYSVWNRPIKTFDGNWHPFGVKFDEEIEGTGGLFARPQNVLEIKKIKELPAMARFARKIALAHIDEPESGSSYKDCSPIERFGIMARKIENFNKDSGGEIHKSIDAFGLDLPTVPCYDALKKGLAALFLFADRHIVKYRHNCCFEFEFNSILVYPLEGYNLASRSGTAHIPFISTVGNFATTRLSERPEEVRAECVLPLTKQQFSEQHDLNHRIQAVFAKTKSFFPFMPPLEEHELITFLQKEPATQLAEAITFFHKNLDKLVLPQYQWALEHILFGLEGSQILDRLFAEDPASLNLLFAFFTKGSEELTKQSPAIQAAAATLFHMHLRLMAWNYRPERHEQLFAHLEKLIESAKSNPILGQALGEAILAALPSCEFILPELIKHQQFLPLVGTAIVLSCIPGDYPHVPYLQLSLCYGYFSFKALMERTGNAEALWRSAALRVFGEKEATSCRLEKDTLHLQTCSLNLADRTIVGGDENSMRLIPKEILHKYEFTNFFGKRSFFANCREEGLSKIYSFSLCGAHYEVHLSLKDDLAIYKQIDGSWYKHRSSLNLPLGHYFSENHAAWRRDDGIVFIENRSTGELIAHGTEEKLYRVENGKKQEEILVTFTTIEQKETIFLHSLFTLRNELSSHLVLWANEVSRKIVRAELPSFDLTFLREEIEGEEVLCSEEFPGFTLAKTQHVPFLKNFSGAIVLENRKGQQKVIVPIARIQDPSSFYDPYTEPTLSLSPPKDNKPPSYLTFDLEDGYPALSPSHHPQIVWLITLYLKTGEYKKALSLFQEMDLVSCHSPDKTTLRLLEELFLDYSVKHYDTHPLAVALRLQIGAWCILHIKGLRVDFIEKTLCRDIDLYEAQPSAHGLFTVSEEILSALRAKLRPYATSGFNFDQKRNSTLLQVNLSKKTRQKIHEVYASGSMIPPRSLAIPGEEFIFNFLYYCHTLYQDDPVKKTLPSSEELSAIIATHGVNALSHFRDSPYEEDTTQKAPLLNALYISVDDPNPTIAGLSRFLLATHTKTASRSSFEEILALFALEDDKAFSTGLQACWGKIKTETFEAKSYLGARKPYLGARYYSGKARFDLSLETKAVVLPRPVPSFLPFTPLPSISLPPPPVPIDFSLWDATYVTTTLRDGSDERQAAEALSLWAHTQAEKHADEPPIHLQFARIASGATQVEQSFQCQLPLQTLRETAPIATSLEIEIGKRLSLLHAKEEEMLSLANDFHDSHALHLEYGRELRTVFDSEMLLIAFGRQDLSAIKNSNPTLSDTEIETLMQRVAEYAYLRSDLQQLQRAHKSLIDAPHEYFMHARAKRAYDPTIHPTLLAFETLANVSLRKEQVDALLSLKDWKLFEARTGFGKSKILLPLWLLLNAESAVFITPATLFGEQERYLQNILKKGWRFFGVTLSYSRDSSSSSDNIALIEEKCKKAARDRKPIFMSDQTAHNLLVLKPKELAQTKSKDLPALMELRREMRTRKLFVDEPQKVLNDAQESNYSIGMPIFLAEDRIQLEIDLYRNFFLTLQECHYQVECWHSQELPPVTEQIYRTILLPRLLEKFAVAPEYHEYLAGRLDLDSQQTFEKGLTDPRIRLLHDQLHYYLPQTLQKNCSEHYALVNPETDRTALPLEDARNARVGNEFVSIDQMVNFTIQANLKIPFSLAYTKKYLDHLGSLAAEEVDKTGKELKKTKGYQLFLQLTQAMKPAPSGLLTLKPFEFAQICDHINTNVFAKLHLIHVSVLPEVRTFEEKVISTPHLLVHCFGDAVGASGTLSMQHFPHVFSVVADEKAIAQTLVALLKRNDPLLEIKTDEKLIGDLRAQSPETSVIIEVGASLRSYPDLLAIGRDVLAHYPEYEGVATFDENGYPIVLKRESTRFIPKELSAVAAEKLFWVYGQKDVTGRDEKLPPHAQAVVFINKDTTLTKLVQGIGRMRGILENQRAHIALDRENAHLIRLVLDKKESDPLTLLDILHYTAYQEGRINGLANFRSLSLQWDALLENFLWDRALRDNLTESFGDIRELLVQSTKDIPLERPSMTMTPVDTARILKQLTTKFQAKVEALTRLEKWCPTTEELADIEKQRLVILGCMPYPSKVFLHQTIDATQVVETLAEQVATRSAEQFAADEQEATSTEESETLSLQLAYVNTQREKKPLPHRDTIEPYSIATLFAHPRLAKYAPLFAGTHLHLSANAFITFEGDRPDAPGFVNGYMKPLPYLALLPTGEYVLVDTQEAAALLRKKDIPMLYLVNEGPLFILNALPDDFALLEIQAKILNGDLRFTPEQKAIIRKWLPDADSLALLHQFIHDILYPLHPELRKTTLEL